MRRFHRPIHRVEQRIRASRSVSIEHLSDQRTGDPGRHADPRAVHGTAKDRTRAMGAVTLEIAVTLGGEVLLHKGHTLKGRVARIDSGVEHGDADTIAIER